MIDTIWRLGNLGLAFTLELAAIVALGYWGFHAADSTGGKFLLGIGTPVVAIVLWALFAAPKASVSSPVLHWITVVLVFGGAAIGLWVSGQHLLGVLLPVVFVTNLAIINSMHLTA
ncbi:MAG TPA: YrdB family protein [Pseudonocardiaceae bacterium]|nr:YrdB family protein [Pseudonocardiaceae bacterium]